MTLRMQIRQWCLAGGLAVLVGTFPSFAQSHRDQQHSVPRPNAQQRQEPRREANQPSHNYQTSRAPERPEVRSTPQYQPAPRPEPRDYRTYQPPSQGHHSGQWLNQHRELSPEQQKRALQNDPNFRRLPRAKQQEYEQHLQRFNSLPPERQQQVLKRMETWEHLTATQKQDFRGLREQFNGLPADRRRAVRNAIEALRAMPPEARQREVQSGRFDQFSPQERQILNDAARLPLAPAESAAPESQEQQNNSGQQRYVPRPPR